MKNIWIVGGAGFVGSALSRRLLVDGYTVVCIDVRASRVPGVVSVEGNIADDVTWNKAGELGLAPDAVINLAGAPIFQRWTARAKESILRSRIDSTRAIATRIAAASITPKVFINASATGYYGDRGEAVVGVDDSPPEVGVSFLSDVCRAWEAEALVAAGACAVRVVRQGIVLGAGGMLAVLRPFFRAGIGGPIGSGEFWMPWIHVDDLVSLYASLISDAAQSVPGFRVTVAAAPVPARNIDFSKAYARSLHRPCVLFVPKFALKFVYGGLAQEISYSQRIAGANMPERFVFMHPELNEALVDLEGKVL